MTTQAPGRHIWEETALLCLALLWLALALFWAPAAVYSIDGFVYHAQIDAAARNGSLFIENDYASYGSPALATTLLRVVDGRLTGQYPGLWGFIAAPAYMAAGLRGVMALNALAAGASLWFVRSMSLSLTGERRLAARAALIFGAAGFLAEYAVGVWPHAAALAATTGAMAAVAARPDPRGALLAGLALGLGLNIRVDAAFMAAPLAVWLLATASRPWAALGALALGLAPGLAASTAVNWVKFGQPVPFTYGAAAGKATLSHFASLAGFAALGALAALSLALAPVRRLLPKPLAWGAAALAAGALIALSPTLRAAAEGWWTIFIDFQAHSGNHPDLARGEDGALRVLGYVKKALFQSLPYAPAALVPAALAFRRNGRAVSFALATAFIATAPFALGAWYGGLSTNMRYLLPATSGLALLTALALDEARRRAAGGALLSAATAAALLLAALAPARGRDLLTRIQIDGADLILLATAVAALAALALGGGRIGRLVARIFRGVVWAGLIWAALLGWGVDLQVSRAVRASNARMAALTTDLPPDALLIVVSARRAAMRMNRPPALTAQGPIRGDRIDDDLAALIRRAFVEGRPVFAQSAWLAKRIEAAGLARVGPPRYGVAEHWLEVFPLSPPER